ncbi:putative transposable element [Trichonephila clavipes]|nr:putative transposable element [Trichonephila clavipes]
MHLASSRVFNQGKTDRQSSSRIHLTQSSTRNNQHSHPWQSAIPFAGASCFTATLTANSSELVSRVGNDEAHFWLNGYVNKQNCRIWSETNPQVYVETPLHPEKLTVWCALWAGGILLQKRRRPQRYSQW